MKSLQTFVFIILFSHLNSQSIGIGTTTPHSSAVVDISSNDKGMLIPRITSSQREGISTPAEGLLVFDVDSSAFVYYNGQNWIFIKDTKNSDPAWSLNGNDDVGNANFLGTINNQALRFKVNNIVAGEINTNGNVALGQQTFFNGGSGTSNTVVGFNAMRNNNGSLNTVMGKDAFQNPGVTAAFNTALGSGAMMNITSGSNNLAAGSEAMLNNSTGSGNVAIGRLAMQNNTTGNSNIGIGITALRGVGMTGEHNIGIGNNTLLNNTTGSNDVAIGREALRANTTGRNNVGIGYRSMFNNSTKSNTVAVGDSTLFLLGSFVLTSSQGINNTALGSKAMFATNQGSGNTAVGNRSLFNNNSGNKNVAVGDSAAIAGTIGDNNTVIGASALKNNTTGSNNTAIGKNAGNGNTAGSRNTFIGSNTRPSSNALVNATAIGDSAVVSANNSLVLGNKSKVGIGTSSPVAKLEVNGKIKINDDVDTPISGMIRWNEMSNDFEGFDGTEWKSFTKSKSGFGLQPTSLGQENQKIVTMDSSMLFGSVAISGDYAVVGAYGFSIPLGGTIPGGAWVFHRVNGLWVEEAELIHTGGQTNDNFGSAVDIDGDDIVVGAHGHDQGGNSNVGAAYVFHRLGNTWTETQLLASNGTVGDEFGIAVAIEGNSIVVGAYKRDTGGSNRGAAYVFNRVSNNWVEDEFIVPSQVVDGANFGSSVDISGNTLVVGVPRDFATFAVAGSTFVFINNGSAWIQQQKISVGHEADDQFGFDVGIDGDDIIIGAPYASYDITESDRGLIYFYHRTGSSWSLQNTKKTTNASDNDLFGTSVSISNGYAVIGAPGKQFFTDNENQGAAYVFKKEGNTWLQETMLTSSDGSEGHLFGVSVSIEGDIIIVGAPFNFNGAFSLVDAEKIGAAYFYYR